MRQGLFIIFFAVMAEMLYAVSPPKDSISFEEINASIKMMDVKYVRHSDWDSLYSIPRHPLFDSMMTPDISERLLAEINSRRRETGDTLRTADLFHIWKPYFEWLMYIDPHYYVNMAVPSEYPKIGFTKKEAARRARELKTKATILPINVLNINDTLIVSASIAPELRAGDMLMSVNGISVDKLMEYNFRSRHDNMYSILNYYYFHGVDKTYTVEFLRDGQYHMVSIDGYADMYSNIDKLYQMETGQAVRSFPEARAGYIKIAEFQKDNKKMVRQIRKQIMKFKKSGFNNIIIDLRNNPGGYGHFLTEFFSIFIGKGPVMLTKSEKLKVSEETKEDYPFITSDDMGHLVEIPQEYITSQIDVNPKYHVNDVDYYVMMDEGTSSTAAFVCNVLQYNGGAKLVGEPLLHNSFIFGDIIDGKRFKEPFLGLLKEGGISTSMSELYTLSHDGVLTPDIHIPYVAGEYSTGHDAMLEKLLDTICCHP